jgi:APA family basic amino acid/polyamine antiporter
VRKPNIRRVGVAVAALDLGTQGLLVVLGFALLFSPNALTKSTSLGTSPSWHAILFSLPLAMLAYTGLETVANLAEEARHPGRDLPRSVFTAVGLVIGTYVLVAIVGLFAFPPRHGTTALGGEWLRSPLMGIVAQLKTHLPTPLADVLRVYVGLSGALILVAAATTSVAGFGRLAYSLGEHGQLPRQFGRLNRRTLVSPEAIVAAVGIASVLLVATASLHRPVAFLASLFSFGVLIAFAAAQLAVLKLRWTDPGRRRPFRVPLTMNVRGRELPLPTVVGLVLTVLVWIAAMVTHPGARYAGPAWLAVGLVLYVFVRRGLGEKLTERIVSPDEQVLPEAQFSRILVPMKLGPIGEEMVATAVKLGAEHGATVEALYVIRVPMELPLDAEMIDHDERAAASLAEARLLGSDHGVEVRTETVRARAIGEAIVSEAKLRAVDLIVVGSAPRWRRQSRFFSPTVEYVLRKAPCEVLVVAFPQGVLEEDETLAPATA